MAEQIDVQTSWAGRELLDANAQKIGTITGLAFPRKKFGTSWLLVDATGAGNLPVPTIAIRATGDRLVLPYPKSYIESGPALAEDAPFTKEQLRRLGLHYGFGEGLGGASCCRTCGLCRSGKVARHPA